MYLDPMDTALTSPATYSRWVLGCTWAVTATLPLLKSYLMEWLEMYTSAMSLVWNQALAM